MRKTIIRAASLFLFASIFFINNASAQQLSDYRYNGKLDVLNNAIRNEIQFNGYTNHWWNDYEKWFRYGNLYKISVPDVEKKIVQNKIDIAEDMNVPGLWMQEGFIMNWLAEPCTLLDNPTPAELTGAANKGNVLVITSPVSETGKILHAGYQGNIAWKQTLKSYQFNDPALIVIDAFMLESGKKKIFVISSANRASALKVKDLLENTKKVVSSYDMHKGWFG
ncbi:MAG TPA: hypothetical protein DDW27_18135, partial [Bacteroidales bacterium]|nr:hypothetical protein [Bacteroidales bacterium]